MRIKLLLIMLLLMLGPPLFAQQSSGILNITTGGTDCSTATNCAQLLVSPVAASASITLGGTWTGTANFEITTDSVPTTWVALSCVPTGSSTAVTSATANGVWLCAAANITSIRVRDAAGMTGTTTVLIRASQAAPSAKLGGGGGSSLPSGTQGCDLSNKDGATGYQTDCSVLKTTDFTSPTYPTFGQAAQACFVAAAARKTSGAICDGRGELGGRSSESGTPDLDVDPFLAATAPFQSILLLPCSQVLTEVGLPITGGTPTSNNSKTHGDSHMYGCGEFGDRNNVTDGHAGTTITAGPSFPACVASSATGLCTTKTGATMTTSVFTTVGNYTQVVTLTLLPAASGYTFTNAIIGSQVIVGTATGNYTYGTITGVTDTTHATVNQGNGQSTAHTGDAFIIEGALTSLGVNSQAGGGNAATYGNTVEKMTLDCNGVAGCIDAQNWYSVEKSGYMHIFFKGYNNIGLDVESTQAQTSGPYDTLFFVPDNGGTGTCTAATLDVVFRNSAPRGLRNSSFANGAGCPNVSTPQSVSVSWDTSLGLGEMLHFENKVVGLGIGAAAVCPVVCPVAVPNPIAANTFTEINASCSNNASAACSTVARIYANVDTTNLINISQSVVNMTNTLVDSQNSNTLTQANNSRVATYFIDTAGKVSYTDANPVSGTEIANAASVCYGGTCNKASSGSLLPVSAPGGSTGQVQYNCASLFCGNANLTFPNATSSGATFAVTQAGNNTDAMQITRNTDTAPTGNFVNFLSVAAVSQFKIDVSGNLTALSLSTSGTNGGVNFLEGTGAGLTAAAAHDLLFGDSTLHCLHQNLNNSDKGCITFAFTSPLVNTNGTLACATCTTNAAGATSNHVMVGGGSQAIVAATNTTDDNTTFTTTDTSGIKSPVFTATGTTAGFWDFPQGTTSTAVAPCNTATSICIQAPTSVTSYLLTMPGAAPAVNNSLKLTSSAGVESYVATIPANSDPNGGIHNFNQATQSQVVVSATEYYITHSDLDMPAVYNTAIGAGTVMKWRITLNKTAAGTGSFQILLKKGTNGSTADTSIVTQTIGTQTNVADNMEADIQLVWTSTTAAYWTIIPRQSAATGTGFGLVFPAVAAQFNGTISAQTTTTASDKYGLSVIFTTGTPTFVVDMVQAEAFGVN